MPFLFLILAVIVMVSPFQDHFKFPMAGMLCVMAVLFDIVPLDVFLRLI